MMTQSDNLVTATMGAVWHPLAIHVINQDPGSWGIVATGQIMITANGGRMINATACLDRHRSWFAVKGSAPQAQ